MVTMRCQQCGNEFRIRFSFVINGRGKYCSLKCYNAKRSFDAINERTRICTKCGFKKSISEFGKYHGGKYRSECSPCKNKSSREYYTNNLEKIKVKQKKYRINLSDEEREKINSRLAKWQKENIEKVKAYWKKSYEKHKTKRRIWAKKYHLSHKEEANKYQRNKLKINSKFHLTAIISRSINQSLKDNGSSKRGKHWEFLVGYTVNDLKSHLESQFKEDMTWDNYGKYGWHIDHIIPISAFNFSSPDHLDFRRCWALNNLQPLWAKENLTKNNKLKESFQPSLNL